MRKVLQAVRLCIIKNIEYTGQGVKKRRDPMPVLIFDSREAEITAKAMEDGLRIRHATIRVNTYRTRMKQQIWDKHASLGCFNALSPS